MSGDIFVNKFVHLKNKPRDNEALEKLKRIASLVKPIMRKHNWRLPVLAEFFPNNPGLLGVNINRGAKICLRLRPHFDEGAFLQEEELIGTMLHELTHNVHGPHDKVFYAFLSKLEDEYYALQVNGYAGEGFYSTGKRLGEGMSHDLPPHMAKQKALTAAEKRRQVSFVTTGAGRLGGRRLTNKSPRELAAEAAERRARDEKTCASGEEGIMEAERAEKDGVDHEVTADYQRSPSPEIVLIDPPPASKASSSRPNQTFNMTGVQKRRQNDHLGPSRSVTKDPQTQRSKTGSTTKSWVCQICTLINEDASASTCSVCASPRDLPVSGTPYNTGSPSAKPAASIDEREDSWACPTCTFANKAITLQCEICGGTRPINTVSSGWLCFSCGEGDNDHQFWTCRTCGTVKKES